MTQFTWQEVWKRHIGLIFALETPLRMNIVEYFGANVRTVQGEDMHRD